MTVNAEDVVRWFAALARVYAENRELLTSLDAAIGDADHGSNMERGFAAVAAELAAHAPSDVSAAFKTAATVLIRTVGGASGPLYGTFFLRAGAACVDATELDAAAVVTVFRAGVEGVAQRGKAVIGDKTMIDALAPAVEAMQSADGLEAVLAAGAAAAEAGMLATVPLQARKGRASYLGARSVGHQDPGATSACLLVRAAAETWRSA